MTLKNDEKSEEKLTCHFKINIRNLMNFDSRTRKSQKFYTFMGCFWPNYIMFELKEYFEELCLIALIIGTKFKANLACISKTWHEEFGKFSP